MYDNKVLKSTNTKTVAYTWDVENPSKVMCIIHGIGEYIGRYDRMAKVLNDAGIAVIGVDLPGHGLSEGKRGTLHLERMCSMLLLRCLISQQRDIPVLT